MSAYELRKTLANFGPTTIVAIACDELDQRLEDMAPRMPDDADLWAMHADAREAVINGDLIEASELIYQLSIQLP